MKMVKSIETEGVEWPEGWEFGSEADLAAERAVHQIYATVWYGPQNRHIFSLFKSAIVKAIAETRGIQ